MDNPDDFRPAQALPGEYHYERDRAEDGDRECVLAGKMIGPVNDYRIIFAQHSILERKVLHARPHFRQTLCQQGGKWIGFSHSGAW